MAKDAGEARYPRFFVDCEISRKTMEPSGARRE
jgi:hypothetical protein